MAAFKHISSIKNPLIKEVLHLQEKSRDRRKQQLFVIEGQREISLAIMGNYRLKTVLFNEDLFSSDAIKSLLKDQNDVEIISISKEIYEKIAHRKSTEGILAIAHFKSLGLNNLHLPDPPLILVAEAPEKPGNIGALLRTADAANIDAVIIANPKTDLYNPNIIRSSVGCIFTTKIASGTTPEIIEFLKQHNINAYAAALHPESVDFTTVDFTEPTAIVVGTEATGLSEAWLKAAKKKIIIPMEGKIDSLNVSVSAAILIFEAKRQRKTAENT